MVFAVVGWMSLHVGRHLRLRVVLGRVRVGQEQEAALRVKAQGSVRSGARRLPEAQESGGVRRVPPLLVPRLPHPGAQGSPRDDWPLYQLVSAIMPDDTRKPRLESADRFCCSTGSVSLLTHSLISVALLLAAS